MKRSVCVKEILAPNVSIKIEGMFFRNSSTRIEETTIRVSNGKMYEERNTNGDYVFTLIQINSFNHMNTLFGLDITGRTIETLAGNLKRHTEIMGGMAFRLHMDQFAIFSRYDDRMRFIRELEQYIGDMEKVHFHDEHITYHHHYTFTYLTYFIDKNEFTPEITDIIGNMEHQINRIGVFSETKGQINNDSGEPDWELQKILLEDMDRGWKDREFVPYYQLVYDVKTKRPLAAELLTRWKHPQKGLIYPGEFGNKRRGGASIKVWLRIPTGLFLLKTNI